MPNEPIIPPMLITRDQAAQMLAVCPRTIDALIKAGELHVIRIGRSVRISVEDMRQWVQRQKVAPAEVS